MCYPDCTLCVLGVLVCSVLCCYTFQRTLPAAGPSAGWRCYRGASHYCACMQQHAAMHCHAHHQIIRLDVLPWPIVADVTLHFVQFVHQPCFQLF